MNILLTGGLGYIASHAAVPLIECGNNVILFDNLSNSDIKVLNNLKKITNQKITFIEGDVADLKLLTQTLKQNDIESIMHFAGYKSVKESSEDPLKYYENNLRSSISLVKAMQQNGIKNIVFSSSATVYGQPRYLPYDEEHPTNPINPYGRTKLFFEEILRDLCKSDPNWSIAILRYFNPIGAHESGLIGEIEGSNPNNLMPHIIKTASTKSVKLKIFGADYETRDGTGERDFIHIMDLADGHIAALSFIKMNPGYHVFNLGSGKSTTVFELIKAFEKVSGKNIPFEIQGRRPGDLDKYYADSTKAKKILNWSVKRTVDDMCSSAWKYKNTNNS